MTDLQFLRGRICVYGRDIEEKQKEKEIIHVAVDPFDGSGTNDHAVPCDQQYL